MKIINKQRIKVLLGIGIILSSCAVNENGCVFRYYEVNCKQDMCIVEKFCDEGALGEHSTGYSIRYNSKYVNLNIMDYVLLDTIYWKEDTINFVMDDFQWLSEFKDSSYYVNIRDRRILINQVNMSTLSNQLIIYDSIKFNEEFMLYKYYFKNSLDNFKNIQYSIAKSGNNLPKKGNLIQASPAFYSSFFKSIKIDSNKIILEYEKRGEEFLFFTNDSLVRRSPIQ